MNTDSIHKADSPLGEPIKHPNMARARSEYRITRAIQGRREWSERTWKERFWPKIKIGGLDQCWPFRTNESNPRYGKVRIMGKRHSFHRVAFQLIRGAIPDGMFVCHSCDNPQCCNPIHLFLGTSKENTQDMLSKGRNRHVPPGEAHPNHKLKDAEVLDMRTLFDSGKYTQRQLSQIYNISNQHVSRLVRRMVRKNHTTL